MRGGTLGARMPPAASAAAVARMDKRFLGRGDAPPEPLRVVEARGSTVVDAEGREYLDFFMGWCVGNLGWGQRGIKARLRRFKGPDYVAPAFRYAPWAEVAALLADMAPGRLARSWRTVGGTESVECALQAAMLHTGRRRFASIEGSYHGNSIGAMSVGASSFRESFDALLPGCSKVKPPLDRKALGRVEALLRKRDVAAFIMEPVVCALGGLAPDEDFMEGVQELCREHGTLLVMDEVACGFGRTGRMFASEHYRIEPDILCLAKALTGGHAPMGATVLTEEVASGIEDEFHFYSTYGWHPLAVEAALANLEYLRKHEDRILRNVAARGRQLRDRLDALDWGGDAEVRGKGLVVGVELGDEARATGIVDRCRRKGLLITSDGGTLRMFPALNLDARTAERGLDILERCVEREA